MGRGRHLSKPYTSTLLGLCLVSDQVYPSEKPVFVGNICSYKIGRVVML